MSLSIDLSDDAPLGMRLRISGTPADFARLARELGQLLDGRWDCKEHAGPFEAGRAWFMQSSQGGYHVHCQTLCDLPPHAPLYGSGFAWACYWPDRDAPADYDPAYLMVDGGDAELSWLRDQFRTAANAVHRTFAPNGQVKAVFGERVSLPLEVLLVRQRRSATIRRDRR